MSPSDPSRGGRLPDVSPEEPGRADAARQTWTGIDQSSVMTVELVSAVLLYGGLGWLLDRWLGTDPWLMGAGVLVGFAAGLYLVWIRSGAQQRRQDEARAALRR
jgi:F0F1-type ATP synthase assembly protein I